MQNSWSADISTSTKNKGSIYSIGLLHVNHESERRRMSQIFFLSQIIFICLFVTSQVYYQRSSAKPEMHDGRPNNDILKMYMKAAQRKSRPWTPSAATQTRGKGSRRKPSLPPKSSLPPPCPHMLSLTPGRYSQCARTLGNW